MSRATVLDAVPDAICVLPEWVLRLALVLAAAAITCGGPLLLAVNVLEQLGGLR